ncbi:MAG TPA: acylphosphatase [Chloroflexi bacterium]|nr:acylphosphatase [Chloroflexota bacterium]
MSDEQKARPEARLHAIVHGLVQGVNFRAFTQHEALKRRLTGWVRNRTDGTVETVAEGDRAALEAFLKFLHRGSPYAQVTKVDASWEEATGEFDDFRIIRYF